LQIFEQPHGFHISVIMQHRTANSRPHTFPV